MFHYVVPHRMAHIFLLHIVDYMVSQSTASLVLICLHFNMNAACFVSKAWWWWWLEILFHLEQQQQNTQKSKQMQQTNKQTNEKK